MEDNVSTGEESENLLIIVLQAFEYHQLEGFLRRRVSGLCKNMRSLMNIKRGIAACRNFKSPRALNTFRTALS
jgi:hypothetical protein